MPATHDPRSVGIIPILNRKIATPAATDNARAQGSTLDNLGASWDRFAEDRVDCKPDRQIEHDPHHSRGDGRHGAIESLVAAEHLDERRS